MTAFEFSDDNKRYHTLNYYNIHKYRCKVYKAAVDAGFSCPNRDGSKGTGGCVFCYERSGYFSHGGGKDVYGSVYSQLCAERERIYKKHSGAPLIAYFQAGSNTYGDLSDIRDALRAAEDFGVSGIALATRADCVCGEVLELLRSTAARLPLTVELGLQTANNDTARLINRCHTFEDFLRGYNMLKGAGVRVCVHIIDGLPHERAEDMLYTARTLGRLLPDAVKIHLLHVIKGTRLYDSYLCGEYVPLEKDEYIDIVVRQLELLPPSTVIERITGDGDKRTLAAPMWSADKISVLGGIDKRLYELDTCQGRLFTEKEGENI